MQSNDDDWWRRLGWTGDWLFRGLHHDGVVEVGCWWLWLLLSDQRGVLHNASLEPDNEPGNLVPIYKAPT